MGAQKEVGAVFLSSRWAGSVELAGYVAENSTAKKDHLDQCSQAPRKPVMPPTKPSYLAFNQLNINILWALLSDANSSWRGARCTGAHITQAADFSSASSHSCQPDRSTGKQRLFPYNKAKPLIKHHRQTLTLIGLNIFGLWLCHSSNNSSGLFQILFLDRKVGKLFGTDNAF